MENLITVETLEQLEALSLYLEDKEFVAYDIETNGLDKGCKIIGLSVCAEVDVAFYVILSYWDVNYLYLKDLETLQGIKPLLHQLATKKLIMHNATFDCMITEDFFGISLIQFVHTDTMVLAHLLDENRMIGLKELGVSIFGEDSRTEQVEMKESVYKNGGVLTKALFELYKADRYLLAKYGAKDALLTLKLFYHLVPDLYEQGLDAFFYEDESMPLLRGPTYELNTMGLRVDPDKLQKLKGELQADCMEAKAFIYQEIALHIKAKYPGTGKSNTFNIGASKQLSWLLFVKLEQRFYTLTKGGKAVCKALGLKIPYTDVAKRELVAMLQECKGRVYEEAKYNPKTKKMGRPKKVADYWHYFGCGKETLSKYAAKYKWVEKYLEYAKDLKILNTYVDGIQKRMTYNIIRPNFKQCGTTSGRYSSSNPNFQNLPRDDKRVKACIVARPGKVFVGADYSQLEPRVFASLSADAILLASFKNGDDFYSVVGREVFNKDGCSLKKDEKESFAKLYPKERQIAKTIALAIPYGATSFQLSRSIDNTPDECQEIIDNYLDRFPGVHELMLNAHEEGKTQGCTKNLFGRPRRVPAALGLKKIYGATPHGELPYDARNMLNLLMNHPIQSTGASIMNRAAIAFNKVSKINAQTDPDWTLVSIVLQVHDELVLEGPENLGPAMAEVLKDVMENTTVLPGVDLIAKPVIAYNLADLK